MVQHTVLRGVHEDAGVVTVSAMRNSEHVVRTYSEISTLDTRRNSEHIMRT